MNVRRDRFVMKEKVYQLGDLVIMKKPHPCGTNEWEIIRMGMDIRIKCIACKRSVLVPRSEFDKMIKKVIGQAKEENE